MKKLTALIVLFLSLSVSVFADNSDTLVYADISAAFNTGFYPGVVDKVNYLEKNYPDSAFLYTSQILKGQSLINMYRYEDAIRTFVPLRKKLTADYENYLKVTFLLAQSYYYNKEYDNALREYYVVCSAGKNGPYYSQSVLDSGNIFFAKEFYVEAVPLLEYVVQNGAQYVKADYYEVLQKLLVCYSNLSEYKKAVELFAQLEEDDFPAEVYCNLSLYAAESYENVNREEYAYKLYGQVVEEGFKTPAVIAMKKAYVLASTGRVSAKPADIFTQATETFEDSPDLVCDFWVRLGIDEFNEKNYVKAKEYFANAQKLVDEGVEFDQTLLALYKAKLLIEGDKKFSEAESYLESIKNDVLHSNIKNVKDSYYASLIQCKVMLQKWNDIPELYDKIQKPDVTTLYNYACAAYKRGDYTECIDFLRDSIGGGSAYFNGSGGTLRGKINEENLCLYELYASANIKKEIYSTALNTYDQIEAAGLLDDSHKVEYAKVLFNCYNYEKAMNVIKTTDYAHRDYLCGLCKINQRDWQGARNCFISYIKEKSRSYDFNFLAYFYKGYAEYNLGNTRDSYVTFIHYATDAPQSQSKFVCMAYEYGAKSALQNEDYKSAASHAEQLIKLSTDEADKQNAILFCAEIYSSIENYERAILVLEPYSLEHNDFAVKCLFQIAKNLEKQKKILAAEENYTRIFTEFPEAEEAEEAMYSLGELYYARGDYQTAENRYNNYIYKFVEGKFTDAALYFCADSNLKMGAVEKSIMMNKNLIGAYPNSVYVYGAYKNLLNAYYETEDYTSALATARLMMSEFADRAAADGVGRSVLELEQIINGTDRQLAEKYTEFESLGGIETKEGRVAGTELVAIYAAEEGGMEEAVRLAKELFEKQTGLDEKYYAAKNADFVASYYRRELENKQAAEMYLKAAEYYRSSSEAETDEIAAALYSAVEAFKADSLDSDAADTAELLVKLYPDSEYASRAKSLVR